MKRDIEIDPREVAAKVIFVVGCVACAIITALAIVYGIRTVGL